MESFNPTSHNQNSAPPAEEGAPPSADPSSIDIADWYPFYLSCQQYFINHAQHQGVVQCMALFMNIRLPFQWTPTPMTNLAPLTLGGTASSSSNAPQSPYYSSVPFAFHSHQPTAVFPQAPRPFLSLIPFLRRLIVTGMDGEGVMHGFFGDDWQRGVGPLHEIERRNYLFAAKSVGWAKVRYQYDISPDETVPFMKPLQRVQLAEIEKSEKTWSEWLAMEDWMVGPRAPPPNVNRPSAMSTEYQDHHHAPHRGHDMAPHP
jgi:hypothetical protein